jgi:hypothetical protein
MKSESGRFEMTPNRMARWALVIAAWSLGGAAALAQPDGPPPRAFPHGSNLAELAVQKDVREQLKLTDEEVVRLKPLVEEINQVRAVAWRKARDLEREERRKKMLELTPTTDKMVADVIEPAQMKRLKQISWQVQGPDAFRSQEVISNLQLSAEQLKQFDRLRREGDEEMARQFQGILSINANIIEKAQEIRAATCDKMVASLSTEQQAKWKEMLGDKFTGEVEFGGLRGRF